MEYIKKSDVLAIIEHEKALRIGYEADIVLFAIEKSVHELETIPIAYDVEKVVAETENVLQDLNVIEIMSHFEVDKTIQKSLENFLTSLKTEVKRIVKNGGI